MAAVPACALREARKPSLRLVRRHWSAIEAVAAALLAAGSLDQAEIERLWAASPTFRAFTPPPPEWFDAP
jgi:uncharacterized membrane protein